MSKPDQKVEAAISQPPPTAAGRPPTSLLFSRGNLVSSSLLSGDKTAIARPSTAVRAVGYVPNSSGSAGQRFDQFFVEKVKQKTLSSNNATTDATKEVSPLIKYKNLETKIIKLLETSILLTSQAKNVTKTRGDHEVVSSQTPTSGSSTSSSAETKAALAEALNKAKEAFSLDRTLHRFRDQHGENIFHNFDLTYAVFFNLAEQYELNDMHIEALNTYSIMTKNRMFPHVNQLKLNMGNIYQHMGLYPKALKMYRMALDSVPNHLKQLRLKITQNIGILFVRMGQYADGAASFEFIMSERPDIRSGIHLILCYYAMGDVEKIKNTFRNLCEMQPIEAEKDWENENSIAKLQQYIASEQQHQYQQTNSIINDASGNDENFHSNETNDNRLNNNATNGKDKQHSTDYNTYNRHLFEALKSDELAVYVNQRRTNEKRAITMIVDLISPIIEDNYNDGYNWCIEVIKTSNLSWLANELELNKALVYLRQNDVNQAIETLQMYDRKNESSMTISALTNLTFVYINLGNVEMAGHCASQLEEVGAFKTSPMALVNASIVDYCKHNYAAARNKLEKALELQPDHFEANYNLGLTAMQENNLPLAEEIFEHIKLQLLAPHSIQHSHVHYQMAKLQEKLHATAVLGGNYKLSNASNALQTYLQVMGISAGDTDSRLFDKVASIYEQLNDNKEANQYYNEAYRINPSDVTIASSIGSYYIKLQALEKALFYYERAVLAVPNEPNLMLRVAGCFRNSYLPPKQYLNMFEKILALFPDSLNCVRALVQVTKSLGMTELNEKYTLEYARMQRAHMERENEQRNQQQRLSSASSSRLGSSRRKVYRQQNENTFLAHQDSGQTSNVITANFNGDHYVRTTEARFSDPLGPPAERPRTGMLNREPSQESEEEEINAESLLPI